MITTLSCANYAVVAAAVFIGVMPPPVAQTVPKPSSDVTRPSRDAIITMTGCLQRERDVLESTGLGRLGGNVLSANNSLRFLPRSSISVFLMTGPDASSRVLALAQSLQTGWRDQSAPCRRRVTRLH